MSYSPTTWETGDTITAEKLNNMEQGIANTGVFYITSTWDNTANGYVLNKTVEQIEAAYSNNQLCMIIGEIIATVIVDNSIEGDNIFISPNILIDQSANILHHEEYYIDTRTGVISVTENMYTLTPVQ